MNQISNKKYVNSGLMKKSPIKTHNVLNVIKIDDRNDLHNASLDVFEYSREDIWKYEIS